MRAHVIATWGTWHERESRRHVIEDTGAEKTEVIELDGVPVGFQRVERTRTHVQLPMGLSARTRIIDALDGDTGVVRLIPATPS
jgi:hypothetical protein